MRYYFLIIFLGLSSCAVVGDKQYCQNIFSAYEISYPIICLQHKNNFQKCLRDEKDKDIEYKKKTGKERPVKLINVTSSDYCKPLMEREVIDKVNSLADIYGVEKIKKPVEDLNKPINQLEVCKGYCMGRFTKMSEQSYYKSACEKNFKQNLNNKILISYLIKIN